MFAGVGFRCLGLRRRQGYEYSGREIPDLGRKLGGGFSGKVRAGLRDGDVYPLEWKRSFVWFQ